MSQRDAFQVHYACKMQLFHISQCSNSLYTKWSSDPYKENITPDNFYIAKEISGSEVSQTIGAREATRIIMERVFQV